MDHTYQKDWYKCYNFQDENDLKKYAKLLDAKDARVDEGTADNSVDIFWEIFEIKLVEYIEADLMNSNLLSTHQNIAAELQERIGDKHGCPWFGEDLINEVGEYLSNIENMPSCLLEENKIEYLELWVKNFYELINIYEVNESKLGKRMFWKNFSSYIEDEFDSKKLTKKFGKKWWSIENRNNVQEFLNNGE